MIAALTFLIGFQLLLSFLNYDISSSPREALHPFLTRSRPASAALEPAQPSTLETGDDLPKPVRRQAAIHL
jgi:dolichol-phosphate mannosyltransferase